MASVNKTIQETAGMLNISYNSKKKFACGVFHGYAIMISPAASNDKTAEIYLCASCNGEPIRENYLQSSRMPQKVAVKIDKFQVHLNVTLKGKKSTDTETIVNAVTATADALNVAGCVNCDAFGVIGETEAYSVRGNKTFLTEESAESVKNSLAKEAKEYAELKVNPFLGIIGALLGSLAGVAVIFLIARLGKVSAIGSAVMGIAVAIGYKKFGKKLTMVSGVLCSLIAVGMTYFAFRLDATVDMYKAIQGTVLEMDFGSCFLYVRELFELANSLSVYNKNFWIMMIAGVAGACVPILVAYEDSKGQFAFFKF